MTRMVHLGDGAYVSFDGYYLWLETDRGDGPERVALEPAGLLELIRFAVGENPEFAEPIIAAVDVSK